VFLLTHQPSFVLSDRLSHYYTNHSTKYPGYNGDLKNVQNESEDQHFVENETQKYHLWNAYPRPTDCSPPKKKTTKVLKKCCIL
jgi:hypothetical protein